jgi:polysaccharide biosynthesis/export protein
MRKSVLLTVLGAAGILMLSGCGSEKFTDLRESIRIAKDEPKRLEVINGRYLVDPPDLLKIAVRDNKELDTEVMVRPDGYITVPLVGDVYVANQTPEKIAENLDAEFGKFIKDVKTTVTVGQFLSKKIYVWGEVPKPGPQPYTGDMTLVEAISQAGSITSRAQPKKVRLTRSDPEQPKVWRVDLTQVTLLGHSDPNLQLMQNDIVFVPPNGWAKVGFALENVFWPFKELLTPLYGYSAFRNVTR